MAKYRVIFYDTAVYSHEFEFDGDVDLDNILNDENYVPLLDAAWASFEEPIYPDVSTTGDWTLSDDPYDISKVD